MTSTKARVSVGLPVHNGERYLREALDSIISQSFSDFELIISDNASTDGTELICREYAERDGRIRYYRNARNMGASFNHNRVFLLSSGEYFKWVAYDDVLGKDFLLRCFELLDRNPSIVLCCCKTGRINESSELQGVYDFGVRLDSDKPHERFYDFITMRNYSWLVLLGVIRSSSLRRTRLFGNYIGTDTNLLSELSLLGPMYEIPEVLFLRRSHSGSYTGMRKKNFKEELGWWTSDSKNFIFPFWRICQEFIRTVRYIPLIRSERLLCYSQIIRYLLSEGLVLMALDIGVVILGPSRLVPMLTPFGRRLFYLALRK